MGGGSITSGIYAIVNKNTKQMYIGQSADIEIRWKAHKRELRNNYHRNNHLQRSWNKYGESTFEFIIIEELANDKELLHEKEIEYIAKYNTFKDPFHYNEAIGGEGTGSGEDHPQYGVPISEEQKRRISMANKGKNNWMYGKTGESNPFYGQKHTEESLQKMSEAKKGKKYTKEEKINLSKSHTSTGIFRVYKKGKNNNQDGFYWAYSYYDENNEKNTITRTDLNELEEEVKRLNLDWIILDKDKAKKTYEENDIIQKSLDPTGIYNVRKNKTKDIKQDFIWVYLRKGQTPISATTLDKLHKKVIDNNLEWKITDEEKAKKSYEEDKQQQDRIERNKEYKDNTGFFRTRKEKDKRYPQGFRWKYYYFQDGKQKTKSSTDLNKLEKMVNEIDQIWKITNEAKAKESIYENNKYHPPKNH